MEDWATSTPTVVGAILLLAGFGVRVVALGVIPENRKPTSGMAWLLLILTSPGLGLVAFWFFGRTAVGRRRRDQQRQANEVIARRVGRAEDGRAASEEPLTQSVVVLNERLGAMPLVDGNEMTLLTDYLGSIAAMAKAIENASVRVHAEFYIVAWDDVTAPVFDAMVAATDRGVEVRLLFDHLGSRSIPGYSDMVARLEKTRIAWHAMLPIRPLKGEMRRPDLRNHRKILVVDGRVGFMGSLNLVEPGYDKPKNHRLGRTWVELMVRLHGPVVRSLEAVFATDWYAESGDVVDVGPAQDTRSAGTEDAGGGGLTAQVLPSGPGFATENNLRMFTALISGATRRVSLTSPYFVPDESLLYAVTTAALRGIDVELFVSEVSDQFMVGHAQASYYGALLAAGVRIHRYPAPFVLHSKHFTVDDSVAVVGSSNMDLRSFALNYEVCLMLLGPDAVSRMRVIEDEYRARSTQLTPEEWSSRPWRLRYVDNLMRLTAALQ